MLCILLKRLDCFFGKASFLQGFVWMSVRQLDYLLIVLLMALRFWDRIV